MSSHEIIPKKEVAIGGTYKIEEIDTAVVRVFLKNHVGQELEKHWVGMGESRGANGYPLLTLGAGPCAVLVFLSEGTQIELAHLPYMFVDRSKHFFQKTREEGSVDKLIEKFSGKNSWSLYLFALAPYDESQRAMEIRNLTTNDLVTRF